MSDIAGVLLAFGWIGGMVAAAGWWKLLAIFVPPYAWYLFIERLMQTWNMAA